MESEKEIGSLNYFPLTPDQKRTPNKIKKKMLTNKMNVALSRNYGKSYLPFACIALIIFWLFFDQPK